MTPQAGIDCDVLIVGGGPVGMTLACELIRHGLDVMIIDKEATTKQYSRAPVFWPRAQEALLLMGVHHLWKGSTVPLRRMNVNVYGAPAGVVVLDQCESACPEPMLVGQDVTENILEQHLASLGNQVERSAEALTVEQFSGGVEATVRGADGNTRILRASWLIGCDGTQSTVREQCGIGWEGHQLKGLMVPVADAQAKWALPQTPGDAYVGLTDDGYLLAIRLPNAWRVIVATPDTTAPGKSPAASLSQVEKMASRALAGPAYLSDPEWVSTVRYGNFIATSFRRDRVILAGDAAHSIAPLSGQGMNIGVQDAMDLAWKLAYVHKGWARDALLDTFTTDRKPVAEQLERFTNRFFGAVLNTGPLQRKLRRTIAPLLLSRQWLRAKIAGFYTGTDIRYGASPLNDTQAHRAPAPGQFARDGGLVRWPLLKKVRLFEALGGRHWTILVLSGGRLDRRLLSEVCESCSYTIARFGADRLQAITVVGAPSAKDISEHQYVQITIDAWQALHKKYGAFAGSVVLIRPDGYVALHRSLGIDSVTAVALLLDNWFTSPGAPGQ